MHTSIRMVTFSKETSLAGSKKNQHILIKRIRKFLKIIKKIKKIKTIIITIKIKKIAIKKVTDILQYF